MTTTPGGTTDSARHDTASQLVVRPATDAELDEAGDVVRRAYAADGHTGDDYLEVVADARQRAGDACVVVAVDAAGRVIGSVTFALPGSRWADLATTDEAEFRMLGVLPSHRGRGAGGALLEWCIGRAHELGRRRLVLCSERSMAAAHRLYLRRGFTRCPDRDWSPLPGLLLLSFALDLT